MPDFFHRLSWSTGNQMELLHNGEQFFPALCAAIEQAKSSVHLESYIFSLDKTGESVLHHIEQACLRGVRVRVVIDGFGSQQDLQALHERFQHLPARLRIYRPPPRRWHDPWISLRRLRRLHRKMAVIDGQIGFIGGINILDDFQDVPNQHGAPSPRFDYALRCTGPIVADMERAQHALWLRMAWRRRSDWEGFSQRLQRWLRYRQERLAARKHPVRSGSQASLVLRDNVRHRRNIERAYLHLLQHAQHDVIIANAYFFPGRRLRKALKQTARRGVQVRLLLQGHAEYFWQYRACCALYQELLDHGLELYEYQASYLHAKVAAIDDYAMLGSSNLDPFSLLLAREANMLIADAQFTAQLRHSLEQELHSHAHRVHNHTWMQRSWLGHALDKLAYTLLRVGVWLTGKSSMY